MGNAKKNKNIKPPNSWLMPSSSAEFLGHFRWISLIKTKVDTIIIKITGRAFNLRISKIKIKAEIEAINNSFQEPFSGNPRGALVPEVERQVAYVKTQCPATGNRTTAWLSILDGTWVNAKNLSN